MMLNPVLVAHGEATYFGTPLQETSLVTDADAVIADSRFADWLTAR
jgi:hypothetical protein